MALDPKKLLDDVMKLPDHLRVLVSNLVSDLINKVPTHEAVEKLQRQAIAKASEASSDRIADEMLRASQGRPDESTEEPTAGEQEPPEKK